METNGTGQTRAWLLISGIAKANMTFAEARSLGTVRQGGWWLWRWCLCLRLLLLLLMRMMRMLILRMLRVLDRRRRYRLVHSDPATLFMQGAAVEVALADGAAVGAVHRTPISRDRLVNVIGALGCMDVDGRTVEWIRALLHQTARHVRLHRLLLLGWR